MNDCATALGLANKLLDVLAASGPHPEHAEQLALFGQFIGGWDVEVHNYPADGPERVVPGEWHFGWVLEGRAIQDVWIAPKRALRTGGDAPPGEYGATLRFYDPQLDAWRSTWHGPVRCIVRPFIGWQLGDEIVLEGSFAPGTATRWIFSHITAESFHWRAEETGDSWQTARVVQEMFATRQNIP
jgi:hypothetical protein